MSSLPFPVRVAAGLVVTAVEEVCDLPRTVVGLPITAVSRVLQMSMRAQQVVTELAIKGDTALEGARPVEDAPSWARFDDDPPASAPRVGERRPSFYDEIDDLDLEEDDDGPAFSTLPTPARTNGVQNGHVEAARGGQGSTAIGELPRGADTAPALGVAEDTASLTPDALPGYETMTLAQLRGKLRSLDVDQLAELLAWESAHADRPPFVTMLTNRIATLSAQQ